MSSFKEALGELSQKTLNSGLELHFSEKELKYYGVKAPKQKVKIMKIKAIRRKSKLDQRAFAIKLGGSPRNLKMWESGEKKPELVNYL